MSAPLNEEDVQAEFNEWAMGFKKLNSNTALEVPGYSEFLDLSLTSERFQLEPSNSLFHLSSFSALREICANITQRVRSRSHE